MQHYTAAGETAERASLPSDQSQPDLRDDDNFMPIKHIDAYSCAKPPDGANK